MDNIHDLEKCAFAQGRRLAGGIKIPLDTDEAHIKDRDLDIL